MSVALMIALVVMAAALVVIVVSGGGLARTRKALAAVAAPWLALPLADWIAGGAVDVDAVGQAVIATVLGLVTFYIPNTDREEVVR